MPTTQAIAIFFISRIPCPSAVRYGVFPLAPFTASSSCSVRWSGIWLVNRTQSHIDPRREMRSQPRILRLTAAALLVSAAVVPAAAGAAQRHRPVAPRVTALVVEHV